MSDVYTIGQIGVEFAGKLTNNDNPYNVTVLDISGYTKLYVRFQRPDGTTFKMDAAPRDDTTLDNTDIVYENDSESIFDQRGDWLFTVGAEYSDGTKIESPMNELFWVV